MSSPSSIHARSPLLGLALALGLTVAAPNPAFAQADPIVIIDQARATAGGVTPGDTPGLPVTLSQPGSYRLSGNLVVPDAQTSAIVITSPGVTLDLNGFALLGPNDCTNTIGGRGVGCSLAGDGRGVHISTGSSQASAYNSGVVIRDGSIRGFGGAGVSSWVAKVQIERLRVVSNGSDGLYLQGGGRVVDVISSANGGRGLSGNHVLVTGSQFDRNRLAGMQLSASSGSGLNLIGPNNGEASVIGQVLAPNVCGWSPC